MKIILFSFFLILLVDSAEAQQRGLRIIKSNGQDIGGYKGSYALLIGVSDYTDGWPDLESIPKEINDVKQALEENGFDRVHLVLNPDSRSLKRQFQDFINQYGYTKENRLLFFFAGHGYSRNNGNKGYLVPTDAPNPELDETGFLRKALTMSRVLNMAKEIEAKHALFLFDSCFSGTIFKTRALPKIPPHIQSYTAKPVRQFITAGSAGEVVPAKSVFAPTFIRALRGAGDLNGDGYVTGMELGLHISQEVAGYRNGQTPQFGKIADPDLNEGDFVFRTFQEDNGLSTEADNVLIAQQDMGQLTSLEMAVWQTVRDSNNVDELQAYVDQFPNGTFTNVAKNRIADLKKQAKSETAPQLYPLYIDAEPKDARIRILNITPKYQYGMKLLPGRYQVEIGIIGINVWKSGPHYDTKKTWITLTPEKTRFTLSYYEKRTPLPVASQNTNDNYVEQVNGVDFTMVAIPGGTFRMGPRKSEQLQVTLKSFYLAETETTWQLYEQCINAGQCGETNDEGWGKGNRPVINVSWNDIQNSFLPWLNQQTGKEYRLPASSEWEYAARAGSITTYHFGHSIQCNQAKYSSSSTGKCNVNESSTVPVKSFLPNTWGLYDMHGNLSELAQDCFAYHMELPINGTALKTGSRCKEAPTRGGSWMESSLGVASSFGFVQNHQRKNKWTGFRLAHDKY